MNLKTGDKVVIIAGKDKGKEGKITKTLRSENKVIVEGVNVVKKHIKPNDQNEGSIVEMEAPIHASNVMILDPKTKKLQYDASRLRYGRIILCADADPDGQAIKNLLLTCFWTLCPELVINGHIHAAIPPLFRITTKKNEYIYLKDGTALEQYKSTHLNEKFQINRAKGLGEQSPDELEYCLLAEDTRNIQRLEVSDMAAADNLLEVLMGTSVPPRREYLLKYGEEAEI